MPELRHGKRPAKGAPLVARSAASEKQWAAQVAGLAAQYGWKRCHFHDSRREVRDRQTGERRIIGDKAAKGFPDEHLVHPRFGIVYAELKTDATDSKPDEDQLAWLSAIARGISAVTLGEVAPAGVGRIVVHVWRPRDLAAIVIPTLSGRRDVPRVYGFELQ